MKTLKSLSLALVAFTALTFSSCQKEGCMDAEAKNYDSTAKKDNKSCTYYTLAEKLAGTWKGTMLASSSGTYVIGGSSTAVGPYTETTNMTLTFNADGTGTSVDDKGNSEQFTWATPTETSVIMDKGKDSEMTFTVTSATKSKQVWTMSKSGSTTDMYGGVTTVNTKADATLTK